MRPTPPNNPKINFLKSVMCKKPANLKYEVYWLTKELGFKMKVHETFHPSVVVKLAAAWEYAFPDEDFDPKNIVVFEFETFHERDFLPKSLPSRAFSLKDTPETMLLPALDLEHPVRILN